MKSISELSIRHRVTTILAVIMISVFGVVFTTQLQMSLLPNIEQPRAIVMCTYSGASPTDIEELVIRPLESAVMAVSGVKEISSTSADGTSSVSITYEDGTDLDNATARLREQLERASLPKDVSKPIILNMDISQLMPSAVVILQGADLARTQQLAEDVVVPALERIKGIASVTVYGGEKQEISIRLDSARAAGYGLGNNYIAQFLSSENLIYPGGNVHNGTKTFTVSTDAKYTSIADVENTIIPLPTGGTVRLGEVAHISIEGKDRDTIGHMDNRKECVILYVNKQSGANEHGAASAAEKRLAELAEANPDMSYYMAYSAAEYINIAVKSAMQNIVLGVFLAAIVVLLFLRRFGPTMTIAISMPVCILTVFISMNVFHLTLNMMSLGGIAMGVGMIVDNSIVVLENIYRYAAMGRSRMDACVEGTKEVTNSVVASTLTTVAVFLPLGLTSGIAGMLFKDFCLTIAFLIIASLIIALTLVPLLCYLMLSEEKIHREMEKLEQQRENRSDRFARLMRRLSSWYSGVLEYFVRHIWVGMLCSLGLMAIFIITCANTTMVLMPETDQSSVEISATLPNGSSMDEGLVIAEQIADVVDKAVPERKTFYYMVSTSSSMVATSGITVGIELVNRNDRDRSAVQISNDLRTALADIAGCEITVSASQMSISDSKDIDVRIMGDDYAILTAIATDLTKQIEALPDSADVSSSVSERVPQVVVTMNRQAAAQYGLTAAQVGTAVRQELTGATATKVTISGTELEVVIKGDGDASRSLDSLRAMPITTATGGTVVLSSVADVTVEQAPQSISRKNQVRQVTISGTTISGDATAMTQQIKKMIDAYALPQGYTAEAGGSSEDMMENFGDLLLALLVAMGLVYFVLAAQFESFTMPVIVMLILPLAFTGALFALPLTGRNISMISLVSLIMLSGTVVNSSIILVDYINVRRQRGEDRADAILHACPLRVRPVLMTTLTTVLAMIPMALATGDTNEMLSDMGVTMISGMVISTIITLFFTPVYYCLIDNIGKKKRKKKTAPALPENA